MPGSVEANEDPFLKVRDYGLLEDGLKAVARHSRKAGSPPHASASAPASLTSTLARSTPGRPSAKAATWSKVADEVS